MKKIILVLICLISFSSFSQENIVDIIMDGKPAKLNTVTGVFTFTNGVPSGYSAAKDISNSKILDGDIHIVSQGETLYAIAKKYQLSITQIKRLNNLETNILSVNQKLKVGYNTPSQIKDAFVYRVKKGETLYSIARAVNVSVSELKQLNNLDNNIINIDQELKLK